MDSYGKYSNEEYIKNKMEMQIALCQLPRDEKAKDIYCVLKQYD